MRRILDRIYKASEVLAALFIVGICLIVLVQVVFNIIDKVAVALGAEAIGLVLPSYAELTGNFLAAATFFALAGALNHGAHIRVTLLIRNLSHSWHKLVEGWCCTMGLVMAGYFAYWSANLAYESWKFDDLSPGILPIPVWIPQLPMTIGLVCLTIAFADSLFKVLRGAEPLYVDKMTSETAPE